MNDLPTATNWYVLTGRPCSGITTTVTALAARGYRTISEAARSIIDRRMAEGMTVEQIRENDAQFQRDIVAHKIEAEAGMPKDEVVFLDRALPDNIVYHAIAGLDPQEVARICQAATYRKIFFMEPLPYSPDYARTESTEALDRLGRDLPEAYRSLGYEVIPVPAAPIERRVAEILNQIHPTL